MGAMWKPFARLTAEECSEAMLTGPAVVALAFLLAAANAASAIPECIHRGPMRGGRCGTIALSTERAEPGKFPTGAVIRNLPRREIYTDLQQIRDQRFKFHCKTYGCYVVVFKNYSYALSAERRLKAEAYHRAALRAEDDENRAKRYTRL